MKAGRCLPTLVAMSLMLAARSSNGKSDAPEIAGRTTEETKLLATGRSLYVTRCIECHSLPRAKEHPAAEWPALVKRMARRSDLTPADQQAVTAYIQALRQK